MLELDTSLSIDLSKLLTKARQLITSSRHRSSVVHLDLFLRNFDSETSVPKHKHFFVKLQFEISDKPNDCCRCKCCKTNKLF